MKPQYEVVKVKDTTFFFTYDPDAPDLLHIYARHLTTIKDAVRLYFVEDPTWNKKRKRFENYSDSHGLYWNWISKEEKKVIVISCFRNPEDGKK